VRFRGPFFVCLAILSAAPAWAVREWFDDYADGDAALRLGHYHKALEYFQRAAKRKPDSDQNARSYGMEFIQYFPYYKQGLCYVKLGEYAQALKMFEMEEQKGAIKRSGEAYTDMRQQRSEAEKGEAQRQARNDVLRFEKEATSLFAAKRYDDALAKIVAASTIAALDPAAQGRLADLQKRIQAAQREAADASARAERLRQVESGLAEGRRLLEDAKPSEALVHFEKALSLDPANSRAAEGRRDAQDRILASMTQAALRARFETGRSLFEAGRYEEALAPLTEAAADPQNAEARDYLDRAQKILQNVRQQKLTSERIEGLLNEAERLIAQEKYAEAHVRLSAVLGLDSSHVRAKERLDFALTMTGEALFARYLPNREPALSIIAPRLDGSNAFEVEGPHTAVVGVANDDRRIVKVEFLVGGKLVGEKTQAAEPGPRAANLTFERTFALEPGLNEITVVATDSTGAQSRETFLITRRLRFFETAAFWPTSFAAAVGLVGAGMGVQHLRRRRAVRRRFNPYIAGAPVMDEELFFGRQKLLARILNVLHHNSLMITGERRIGKTTFLYHLRKALEKDDGTEYMFFPVFTDMQGVTEADFFHAVMTDVVEALTPNLAPLRFRPEEETGYDGRDFSHDLQRVIEELKTRTAKKVKLALLIDEVDVLNEFSERINQRLRSIFMKTFSENLVAIMSGVGIRRTWQSEGSPWYNFFDEIELKAFSRGDAEALIRTPVEGVFRWEPEAVELILERSELKPYVIQRFCIYSVNRMIEDGRTTITARDVEAVREAVQVEGALAEGESGLGHPASA
jgi:tetratricopeptide (TPR) repeat protein